MYIIVCILAVLYVILGSFDTFERDSYTDTCSDASWPVLTELFSITVGLTISVSVLLYNMKLFFPHVLKDEKRRVKTIFLVYTTAYFTRAVIFLVYNEWLCDNYVESYIMYYTLYIFWDILPLSLIMWYHYISFKSQIPSTASASAEEDEQSDESMSEGRSTMSSQRSDSFASSAASLLNGPSGQSQTMPERSQSFDYSHRFFAP